MTGGTICGLAFVDGNTLEGRQAALDDMAGRWPRAHFCAAPDETAPVAARVFGGPRAELREPVPVLLIGTPFDISVWQALLRIPMGRLVSYTAIARHLGQPSSARAVGTANGRNPISFIVPCHRALRGDGTLGGYYWGLERKRAMIAWEAARAGANV
jgi:AraC family transcriptional regulator of adaptative response/methylated-DNA-[protein]-cysteine methyltransferase